MVHREALGRAWSKRPLKVAPTLHRVLISTSLVALAQTAPAVAQVAPNDAGDIVVTAERRETTVQKTPISIAVFQGADLIARDVTTVQGLSRIAPDISFTQSDGSPIIAIRGISSQNTGAVGDPAVAVSTDGFYLNRPYALTSSFYDIERVEVLRGPQGTLNGRNSDGGAINILTVRPKDTFGGYLTGEYGNYNAFGVQGAINVPLGDKVQTRVSFLEHRHDCYRETPPQGCGDDEDTQSIRGQVSLEPTDRLKLWLMGQYNHIGGSPGVSQNVPFVYLPDGSIDTALPAGINDRRFAAYVPNYTRLNEYTIKWSASYDFGPAMLTYLGGYDSTKYLRQDDNSNNGLIYGFRSNEKPKTVNQEVRLASAEGSRLFWQVGAFYFRERSYLYSGEYYAESGGAYARGYTYSYNIKSSSLAGFGQASYKITDKLTFRGGLRYTHDKKHRYGYVQFPDDDVPVDPVSYFTATQDNAGSWNKLTWQAGVDYQFTNRNMLYGKVSTGYKAGGFVPLASYKPESVTSYEIGSKNKFANGLLQLNVAAHYEDYKDQQVSQVAALPQGGVATLIRNAGSSHIYGLETDIVLVPSKDDRITATIDYLHARFHDFATVENGVNVQLAGNRPPNAPDWSIGLGFEHLFRLDAGTVTLSADSKFQSNQYFDYFNYAATAQKAYSMTNARLMFAPAAGRWTATLFVNNIENRRVFTNAVEDGFTGSYHYSFYAPRTFGGRISVTW